MHDAPTYRRIGIIGTGRVARAMALALQRHSADPLLLWGRNDSRRANLAATIGHSRPVHDLAVLARSCDLILMAVSDDAVATVAGSLAALLPGGTAPFVVHLSGRSGAAILAPLQRHGAAVAAVHPVMTFTGDADREVARMVGARFVVTVPEPAFMAGAQRLVTLLGGVVEVVAEAQRPLYHAALCHAANHLVTLIAGSRAALATAGVTDPGALLGPLVRAALDNSLDRGLAALSGPLLRGDRDSIRDHLAALSAQCPSVLPAYRAMAVATLDALEQGGDPVSPALRQDLG